MYFNMNINIYININIYTNINISISISLTIGLTADERIELAALVEEEERLEREEEMMITETEAEIESEIGPEVEVEEVVSKMCDEETQDLSIPKNENENEKSAISSDKNNSVVEEISVCENTEMAANTETVSEDISSSLNSKESSDAIEKREKGQEGEKREEGEKKGSVDRIQESVMLETVVNTNEKTEIAPEQYKSTTTEIQNSVVEKEVVTEEVLNLSTNSIIVTVDDLYGIQDEENMIESEMNPMTNYVPPPPYPNPAPPRLSFISMENPLKEKKITASKNTPIRINEPVSVPVALTNTNITGNPMFFDVNMRGAKSNIDDEWDVDLLASSPLPVKVRYPCFWLLKFLFLMVRIRVFNV